MSTLAMTIFAAGTVCRLYVCIIFTPTYAVITPSTIAPVSDTDVLNLIFYPTSFATALPLDAHGRLSGDFGVLVHQISLRAAPEPDEQTCFNTHVAPIRLHRHTHVPHAVNRQPVHGHVVPVRRKADALHDGVNGGDGGDLPLAVVRVLRRHTGANA